MAIWHGRFNIIETEFCGQPKVNMNVIDVLQIEGAKSREYYLRISRDISAAP